ncbi:MAG: response regulator [Ginsengibacter sp.]
MKKILIADDNCDILYIVELILKKNGFEVFTTDNGENVIEETKIHQPQLVLLDVYMAGVDGRDICKILKNTEETKNIPVIMFSAHTNKTEIMKACKADDFISKPFDSKDLVNKINNQIKNFKN